MNSGREENLVMLSHVRKVASRMMNTERIYINRFRDFTTEEMIMLALFLPMFTQSPKIKVPRRDSLGARVGLPQPHCSASTTPKTFVFGAYARQ
jgi:hypothetical protein